MFNSFMGDGQDVDQVLKNEQIEHVMENIVNEGLKHYRDVSESRGHY